VRRLAPDDPHRRAWQSDYVEKSQQSEKERLIHKGISEFSTENTIKNKRLTLRRFDGMEQNSVVTK